MFSKLFFRRRKDTRTADIPPASSFVNLILACRNKDELDEAYLKRKMQKERAAFFVERFDELDEVTWALEYRPARVPRVAKGRAGILEHRKKL